MKVYTMPRTRFVILTVPRTGSNYLCSLLNSHPDILCHHEIFNPRGIHYALDCRDGRIDLGSMEERERAPVAFLQRVWEHPLGHPVVGFKLGWRHPAEVFQAVYDDHNDLIIVLRHRNVVKMYVAEQVAKREGQWTHYYMEPHVLPRIQVEIDVQDLKQYLGLMDRFFEDIFRTLQSSGQPYLE